jgi:hypothetical protein
MEWKTEDSIVGSGRWSNRYQSTQNHSDAIPNRNIHKQRKIIQLRGVNMNNECEEENKKKPYDKPHVTIYGPVEVITEGSPPV